MTLNEAWERYRPIMAKAKEIEKWEKHGPVLWDERTANQETYRTLRDEVSQEGAVFIRCFMLGKEMLERENKCIDINNQIENMGEVLNCLKRNGITRLTLSGTSAISTAWTLKRYDWRILDLIEINGNHKDFHTGTWERIPAYLFGIRG